MHVSASAAVDEPCSATRYIRSMCTPPEPPNDRSIQEGASLPEQPQMIVKENTPDPVLRHD
eukprot:5134772-Karenia_brevis.AAC.1